MGNFAEDLLNNKALVVAYFAVLLLLMVFILYNVRVSVLGKAERMIGTGSARTSQSLFSGPDIRRLGQEFSSTNQGDQTTVYIPEIKEILPDVVGPDRERLVNVREPPVFYNIGSALEAYQQGAVPEMRTAVASGQTSAEGGVGGEYFASGSPAAIYQEDVLRQKLYQ